MSIRSSILGFVSYHGESPTVESPLERSYYDNEDIWQPARYGGIETQRAQLVISRIPDAAGSVLDVGCGNGVVTNQIEPGRLAVGVDRSPAALRWVTKPRIRANITDLPFGDAAFDAVLATEVLEHLPQALYPLALDELARVARRYILVTVPYCENLALAHCTCPECGCQFHPSYHMRSYARADLQRLFHRPDIQLLQTQPIFRADRYVLVPRIRKAFRRQVTSLPRFAVCPQCGLDGRYQAEPALPRDPYNKLQTRLRELARRVWPRVAAYRWWIALYEKQPVYSDRMERQRS